MSSERMEDQAGTPRGPPPGQWGLLVPGGPLRGCSPHAPPSDSWRRHSQNMKSSVQSVLHSAAPRPPGDPVPQPGRYPPAPICASNPSWTFLASGAKERPPSAAHGHLRSTEAGGSGGVWVQTHTPTPAPWSPLALPPAPLPRPTGPPGVGYGVLSHDIKTGRATGAWLRDSGSPARPACAGCVCPHYSQVRVVGGGPWGPTARPPSPRLSRLSSVAEVGKGIAAPGGCLVSDLLPCPPHPQLRHQAARAEPPPGEGPCVADGLWDFRRRAAGTGPPAPPVPHARAGSGIWGQTDRSKCARSVTGHRPQRPAAAFWGSAARLPGPRPPAGSSPHA